MSQGELPESSEARLALIRFFGELLPEVWRKFKVTPGELINQKFKKQHITSAREWVVQELRQNVWQWGCGKRMQLLITTDLYARKLYAEDADKWRPVSYPVMADLLGFHHSVLVYMMQRITKRKAKEAREANETLTTASLLP